MLNFFLSKYMNNTRTKNKTLSPLKIFFERNNKVTNTITNLGNVFRNSKWTDLKFQNIKTSHVNQQVYFFFTCIFFLFVMYYIILQPTSLVWNTIIYIKRTISLFLQMTFFLISIYVTLTFYWITNFFVKTEQKIHNNLFLKETSINNVKLHNAVTFNNDTTNINNWNSNATQFINLYKTTDLIHKLNNTRVNNIFEELNFDYKNKNFIYQILPTSLTTNKSADLTLLKNDHKYIINSISSSHFNSIKTYSLTPNEINTLLSSNPDLGLKLFDLKTPMNLAKQDRWLLKNSFISSNLNSSNNAGIASKRLLGSNLTNSNITENNIWASNYLNNRNISQISSNLNLVNKNIFEQYNFFEISKEFAIKRYWEVINPQHLITTQSFVLNNDSSKNSYISNNSYAIYNNTMQQSFNNDLSMFLFNVGNKTSYSTINIKSQNQNFLELNLLINSSEFLINDSLIMLNNLPTTNISNLNKIPQNKNISTLNF